MLPLVLAAGLTLAAAPAPERAWHPAAGTPSRWRVDLASVRTALESATLESGTTVEIALPLPDGRLERFRAAETSLMSPGLRRRVPGFRAYAATAVAGGGQARLDLSTHGLRAIVLTPAGVAVVDPAGEQGRVRVGWLRDFDTGAGECEVVPLATGAPAGVASAGAELRILRYVLLATGEYAQAAGGAPAATAHLLTQINRINAILERDLALRLEVVAAHAFEDPATDPYPNPAMAAILDRNTAVADSLFGSAAYDLGQAFTHMPGSTPRGVAFAPVSCTEGYKAGCVVGSTHVGSIAEMLTMGHELGHAIGYATHTQDRSCNRSSETPYEVSSGITIVSSMPAACPPDFQPQRDPFYHGSSIERCLGHLATLPGCGTTVATDNTPPTVDAGPDLVIPRGTPFVLGGSASDPDAGDTLTFTWEQFDRAPASGDPIRGPLFRWRPPSPSPERVMPAMATVLSGAGDPWETLPAADRTLRFRLTVRDNHPGAGGIAWDERVLTVSGSPFAVTHPDGGNTFASGESFDVTWQNGPTATAVSLWLSTDGGATWNLLRSSTPNDGHETVAFLTASGSTQCRIRVAAVDNIFFDVSNADFTITPGAAAAEPGPPPPAVALAAARPNPARGGVQLAFALPRAMAVDLAVFGVTGRRLATLVAGERPAGRHEVAWDGTGPGGRRLAPGVYVVRLEAGGRRLATRLQLLH